MALQRDPAARDLARALERGPARERGPVVASSQVVVNDLAAHVPVAGGHRPETSTTFSILVDLAVVVPADLGQAPLLVALWPAALPPHSCTIVQEVFNRVPEAVGAQVPATLRTIDPRRARAQTVVVSNVRLLGLAPMAAEFNVQLLGPALTGAALNVQLAPAKMAAAFNVPIDPDDPVKMAVAFAPTDQDDRARTAVAFDLIAPDDPVRMAAVFAPIDLDDQARTATDFPIGRIAPIAPAKVAAASSGVPATGPIIAPIAFQIAIVGTIGVTIIATTSGTTGTTTGTTTTGTTAIGGVATTSGTTARRLTIGVGRRGRR